ncbi:hypothetical protein Pdw03_1608 [Penicillium digitatum]|uniref:Uncharacterized protein n=1 Tax=Penicillium digitatum TaxID=36651 RepID=A0A7T6XSQ3_PENDI|nr:hypothetical protein Pdw03_1608 [Penicillium digitatum]
MTIFYACRQQLPFSPYVGDGRVALVGQILRAYSRPPHSKSKPSHCKGNIQFILRQLSNLKYWKNKEYLLRILLSQHVYR